MATETPPPDRRPAVVWPDGSQIARQAAIVAVVILVWGGLFWGAMRIPGSASGERTAAAEARRDARRAAAEGDTAPGDPGAAAPEDAPAPDQAVTAQADPAQADPASADPASTPPAADPAPPPASTPGTAAAPPPDPDPDPAPTPVPVAATPADVPLEQQTLDPIDEAAAAADDVGEVSFAADVLPILERRCIKCHGGLRDDGTQRIEEGLNLLTVADILAGSTWGSVVEPGDVAGSYLYELVESGDMPDNEPRLLPRELRLIAAWIRQGAPSN